MPYVTRGTVQVTIKHDGCIEMQIAPNQDYAVTHEKRNYTIFVDTNKPTDVDTEKLTDSKLFPAGKTFELLSSTNDLKEALVQAAIWKTCLEVTIDHTPAQNNKGESTESDKDTPAQNNKDKSTESNKHMREFVVTQIKIPATS